MKTLVDPTYAIHTTAGQYIALLAYHLADDPLLPYDLDAFGRNLDYWARDVTSLTISCCGSAGATQQAVNLTTLIDAFRRFKDVAKQYQKVTSTDAFLQDDAKVQATNAKLKKLLRLFVREAGLPDRGFYKTALFAPNREDGYKAQTLPAVVEGLQDRNLSQAKEWNLFLVDAVDKASEMFTLP